MHGKRCNFGEILSYRSKDEELFQGIQEHIKRMKNTKADELAKATAKKAALPPDVFFQVIKDPSVKIVEPSL
jgi:hypothetical protein